MTDIIFPLLAVIVAAFAAVFVYYQSRLMQRIAGIHATVTLLQYLQDPGLNAARTIVRKGNSVDSQGGDFDEAARLVCSSFDYAGCLVRRKGYIDRDAFMAHWANSILTLGKQLESFLQADDDGTMRRREERWTSFVWLIDYSNHYNADRDPALQRHRF